MINNILWVGLGGSIGCILRYVLSVLISRTSFGSFPLATFAVNIIGCLIAGIIFGILNNQPASHPLRLLFITGFCGGFTTFSAFGIENVSLMQSGHYSTFLCYMFGSILFGLLATGLGMFLGNRLY